MHSLYCLQLYGCHIGWVKVDAPAPSPPEAPAVSATCSCMPGSPVEQQRSSGVTPALSCQQLVPVQGTDSWVSMHGGDAFQHPYCMQLFLGKDENGDYIPIRQLRDKYLQQREDIHPKSGQAESE